MNEIKKEISGELDFDIKLEGASAVLTFKHEGKLGFAELKAGVNAAQLVDKITDIIPGEWDDTLLDDLAARVLSKKTGK